MRQLHAIASAAIFFAAAACGFAADEALPKAETVLDKFFEATGGKARYQKLTNQVNSGEFAAPGQGVSGTIKIYRAAPNRSRTVVDLGSIGMIEEGVDGDLAWQVSPMTGPRLKTGAEKAFAIRAAAFNSEVRWRDHYDRVELTGVEKVDDRDCYKIVMSGKDANSQTRYYDTKTNLLVKITLIAATVAGEVIADTLMSDYREEGGMISPHKLVQNAGGQQIVITINKVEYNTALPEGAFDPPSEIKELVAAPRRAQ